MLYIQTISIILRQLNKSRQHRIYTEIQKFSNFSSLWKLGTYKPMPEDQILLLSSFEKSNNMEYCICNLS